MSNQQRDFIKGLQTQRRDKNYEKNEDSFARNDKNYIMKETQTFNDSKFSDENSRWILVELMYLLNQGIQFNDQETETIFFRITKLFQSNNPKLRQTTYQSLKIIMPQKYAHILIQCICKDLMSDDQHIQLQAFKFIPYLQSEQYIQQVERYIQNALLDTNLLISSAAFIAGIHIINKYPNIVGKWLFEVIQRIGQPKQNLQYHSLILLHEMKKPNLSQFIKLLIQMTNEQQSPLVELQIIKFIEETLPYLSNQWNQPLMNYLIQMANNQNQMLRFQSISTLVKTLEVQNQEIYPLIQSFTELLKTPFNFLKRLSALHIISSLVNYPQRVPILDASIMGVINALNFSYNVEIAQKSLLIYAQVNEYRGHDELSDSFERYNVIKWQYNFLDGLLELVSVYPIYVNFALSFINKTKIQFCDIGLASITLQIIEIIQTNSQSTNGALLQTLMKITEQELDLKLQFSVIKIITKFYLQINIQQINDQQIKLIYSNIKEKLQYYFNMNYNYQQFTLIREDIIHQLNGFNYINQGDQSQNKEYGQQAKKITKQIKKQPNQ